ncbi:MAG TPA: HAD family hydrolase [Candidatus Nanoarchaeia archaeon]|nr:HAD family hydrolase [Candidatus Nanoarchaeia archaeon]
MKQIIFFDGDGTLWYPEKTAYQQLPHWIYKDPKTSMDPLKHLILTPHAKATLTELRAQEIQVVLLSTHPHPPDEAARILQAKIRHFQLEGYFDEVHATRAYEASKGEFMVEILKRRKIPKDGALMVGDTYNWDYKSAKDQGIDALLMESVYQKQHPQGRGVRRTITGLKEILDYI